MEIQRCAFMAKCRSIASAIVNLAPDRLAVQNAFHRADLYPRYLGRHGEDRFRPLAYVHRPRRSTGCKSRRAFAGQEQSRRWFDGGSGSNSLVNEVALDALAVIDASTVRLNRVQTDRGKPHVIMPFIGGVAVYRAFCEKVAANDYAGFERRATIET